MASQIHALFYIRTDITVCSCRNIVQTIGAAFTTFITGKFVNRTAGLKSEMFINIKTGFLAENGNVKFPAVPYQVMGKIRLIYRNTDPVGIRSNLLRRIDDTAAVFSSTKPIIS